MWVSLPAFLNLFTQTVAHYAWACAPEIRLMFTRMSASKAQPSRKTLSVSRLLRLLFSLWLIFVQQETVRQTVIWSVAPLSEKTAQTGEKTPRPSVRCHSKAREAAEAADVAPNACGGIWKVGLIFFLVIYMMHSDWALNNGDKWSARQASPRELLRQSLGPIALPGLPAATHTLHTWQSVCVLRRLGAWKGINKAELVVIHGANVCGSEVKRVKLIFCMATRWTPLTCGGLVMICRPHEFEFRDSF